MSSRSAGLSSLPPSRASALPERTLWLMAVACGACVANIFYNQPLLENFAAYFGATSSQVGWISIAGQAGYALGLLFFLPLGDIVERRRLVLVLTSISAILLAATAAAPNLPLLILAHLLVGCATVGAQILIPLAVELSPPERRGHTVGVMMTGLLGGVLLARTLAGFVGDHFGWRAMFGLAAALMLALAAAMRKGLPHSPPTLTLSYRRLMGSLWSVLKTQPRLWRPTLVGGLSFATFTAFWTSLAFLMREEFHRGATETGLFGLVGLSGALTAPHAGKLADKRGTIFTVSLALAAILAAFGIMWAWVTIPGLILGVILMDVGVQAVQVAEQGQVLTLLPEARSRVNTLYMIGRMAGGALGSLVGALAWTHGHWPAVCGAAGGLCVLAMTVHALGRRFESTVPARAF